jgi:hypothetical protein
MDALAREGALVEPFLCDGVTVTRRAIPALWCGSWEPPEIFRDPDCGGEENQRAAIPTVFEYYRRHLDRPAKDCVYILGPVSCTWKPSVHPDYGPRFWPRTITEANRDRERWDLAREILVRDRPGFLLLYLSDVDRAGDDGDWEGYTAAIREADAIVGELWGFLQGHSHYAGRTTLIVTNDHGRHTEDFSGHGDGCAGCRTIQLLMIGPDTPPGLLSRRPRTIPDVAPTLGALLGFPTPHVTGEAMMELLRTAASPARK